MEQKLTKPQIFEFYANSIYLGNQGSFSINGFGEGALAYFGKDLSEVTLPEAAMLAGLPQSGRWNPFRFPERAQARRNIVLKNMLENGYITKKEFDEASATPVAVKRGALEFSDAPYFVDMIDDTLRDKFPERDFQRDPYRVYTTLDLNLQKDAVEAVRKGLEETDAQWHRRSKKYGTDEFPLAQVALVALDAETGEVKAIVGGRNYGLSQLNHVLAKRQPGSSFKPFVFLAALEKGFRPDDMVLDAPIRVGGWSPGNYDGRFRGSITIEDALAHSINTATVRLLLQAGGPRAVTAVARRLGITTNLPPDDTIALGTGDRNDSPRLDVAARWRPTRDLQYLAQYLLVDCLGCEVADRATLTNGI